MLMTATVLASILRASAPPIRGSDTGPSRLPVGSREPSRDCTPAGCAVAIEESMAMLPPAQHEVIMLRDVEGWTSREVRQALGIAETTQRRLLHQARSRMRAALDAMVQGG